MHRRAALILVATFAASLADFVFSAEPPTISIDSGRISGVVLGEKHDVHAYLGVPFAAPPVGDLRWRPPQPVKPWDGVRECSEFGSACPQPTVPIISSEITRTGEDCLNLNIWAPAPQSGKRFPVMVWIHGGAYNIGANYQGWFNGEALARHGVVLVAINYRLGPFGFFAHPLLSKESKEGVSGNYGLLDQIAALKWVQRNIAAFGGDPHCVTIFGESAGAGSVCHLLVSPLAKGLFHRAIAESGGARGPTRHLREKWYGKESAETVGVALAKSLHCDKAENPLAALRGKSVADLVKVIDASKGRMGEDLCAPIVDGWVVPDDPCLLFEEGKTHDVPFITGSNANEIDGLLGDWAVRGVYREKADAVFKLFSPSTQTHAGTVAIFTFVARSDARAMSRHTSKAYLYQFSRVALPWHWLGAFHASEICYVFGNLDATKLAFDATDHELSRKMMAYWLNFARSGDPNGEGLPRWPTYDAKTDMHMEFGDRVQAEAGLCKSECDGLDRLRVERMQKRKGT